MERTAKKKVLALRNTNCNVHVHFPFYSSSDPYVSVENKIYATS